MDKILLNIFIVFAVVGAATACPAKCRTGYRNGRAVKECSCREHPGKIYVDLTSVGHGDKCLDQCGSCPNGFCHENKCYCFDNKPSNGRACPKFCQDCEGEFCTGWAECENNFAYGGPVSPPICPGGCRGGQCLHPGVCNCDIGYYHSYQAGGCEPLCFTDCTNGFCSAPGTCTCNPGYVLTPHGSCAHFGINTRFPAHVQND